MTTLLCKLEGVVLRCATPTHCGVLHLGVCCVLSCRVCCADQAVVFAAMVYLQCRCPDLASVQPPAAWKLAFLDSAATAAAFPAGLHTTPTLCCSKLTMCFELSS